MIAAFVTLLLCQLTGEILVRLSGAPVPGPVLGMLLLFAGLAALRRVPKSLHGVADFLLANMTLLFVPAAVGVLLHVDRIVTEWVAIVGALLISTLASIAATALAMRAVLRRMPPRKPEDE